MNFFKVYEILDNVEEKLENYPTYFVGAFVNKNSAEELCKYIDIADCNSTKINYGEILESDVLDLQNFGLQGFDEEALKEIKNIFNKLKKQNNEEIIK